MNKKSVKKEKSPPQWECKLPPIGLCVEYLILSWSTVSPKDGETFGGDRKELTEDRPLKLLPVPQLPVCGELSSHGTHSRCHTSPLYGLESAEARTVGYYSRGLAHPPKQNKAHNHWLAHGSTSSRIFFSKAINSNLHFTEKQTNMVISEMQG